MLLSWNVNCTKVKWIFHLPLEVCNRIGKVGQNGELKGAFHSLVANEKSTKENSGKLVNSTHYRSLVGSLLYLTIIKPINFISWVSILSS